MRKNELPESVAAFINKYERRMELILWSFVVITLLLFELEIEQAAHLIGISFTLLAMYYFLLAFIPSKSMIFYKAIAFKIANISSSVSVVGIMYKFLNLPGAEPMIFIGIFSMSASSAVLIMSNLNQWDEKMTRLSMRVSILCCLGFIA